MHFGGNVLLFRPAWALILDINSISPPIGIAPFQGLSVCNVRATVASIYIIRGHNVGKEI